jgi:hypothetical protein
MYPTAERFGDASLFLPTDYLFLAPSQEVWVFFFFLRRLLTQRPPVLFISQREPRNFVKAVRGQNYKISFKEK